MPSQKNQDQLKTIKDALADSQAIILTNYSGLSVAALGQLRSEIAQAGGSYQVYKNTLLKLAFKDKLGELPENISSALEGQTAILITREDPIISTKALMQFKNENERPQVKLGLIDGTLVTPLQIEALSKLPGKEQLLANLAAQLNAPISSFAQVLRVNLQNLVYVFDAIARSKS